MTRIVLERKGRACAWCRSRQHVADDCPDKPENAALRERIAERQSRVWQPRKPPPRRK